MVTPLMYCAENGSMNTLKPSWRDQVVLGGLVLDEQAVLEAAAAARLHAHAQARPCRT
jgi:hypothetical protein